MNKYSKIVLIVILLFSGNTFSQSIYKCEVTKIVDGDTIYCIKSKEEKKVRLIGVDAPESIITTKAYQDAEKTGDTIETIKKMGERSKNFVTNYLNPGTDIKLEFDIQKIDRYGRTLAYVYLPDGTMLNELIVKEGYAQVSTYPPNVKYEKLFLKRQQEARENKRGLWK